MKAKLEAINVLLDTINDLPITSEEDIGSIPEAQKAEAILEEVKRDVLAMGWSFNTDENYPFAPSQEGYISIPENVLDIVSLESNIIMRDWRLYDRTRHTATFDRKVSCTVLWDIKFNSLTYPMRNYITIRASRVFQERMFGSVEESRLTEDDEQKALVSALRSDQRTQRFNMLDSEFGNNTLERMS